MYRLLLKKNDEYKELIISEEGGLILQTSEPLEYKFGKAHKTYTITIPNFGENNYYLDNLFNKQFEYNVIYNDVYLGIENNIWFKGVLKVNSFDGNEAKCQFITEYTTLLEKLKATKLNELDYGLDIIQYYENMLDGNEAGYLDGNIIFDLVDRGRSRPHKLYNDNSKIDASERLPAVKVKRIIDKIFAGYNLIGNFFDNEFYDKMYLLFTEENQNITETSDFIDDYKAKIIRDEPLEYEGNYVGHNQHYRGVRIGTSDYLTVFNLVDVDPADGYNTQTWSEGIGGLNGQEQWFEVQKNGVYNIQFNVKGFCQLGTTTFPKKRIIRVSLFTGDAGAETERIFREYETEYPGLAGADGYGEYDFSYDYSIGTGLYYLQAGVKYKVRIYFEWRTGTTFEDIPTGVDLTFKIDPELIIRASTGIGYMSSYRIEDFIPDMTIADFIKMILKEFNCQIFINQDKNLIEFHQIENDVNIIDVTNRIIKDSINVKPDNKRNSYLFKHKLDSNDAIMKYYYDLDNSINGDYLFNVTDSQETDIIESDFSQSIEDNVQRWGINDKTIILWNEYDPLGDIPELKTKYNYRLVYFCGEYDCSLNTIYYSQFGTEVDNLSTKYPRLSTNYSPAVNDTFNSKFNGDLFDMFHKQTITNKVYGHLLECEMILNDDFISSLYYLDTEKDWRNIFSINIPGFSGYYRLFRLERKDDNIYNAKFYKELK